jgi:hypothetical protein
MFSTTPPAAQMTVYRLRQNKRVNAVAILGDLSYARGCEVYGCTDWDAFQRMFSLVAAHLPVSIVIGNHEME